MVNRVYHLDRGFERLEDQLGSCGAADRAGQPADLLIKRLHQSILVMAGLVVQPGEIPDGCSGT